MKSHCESISFNIRAGNDWKPSLPLILLVGRLLLLQVGTAGGEQVNVQIYIVDVPARQIAEWGQLLPRPGEEAAWNAAIPAEVKQRMDQLLA